MLLVVQTALELGFLYAPVALALFLSFRVLDIADLTTDGCFVLGAAVSVTLTAAGHPLLAVPVAMLAGACAGFITAFLQTRLSVPSILAGIVTNTGLYTINLMAMGWRSNESLLGSDTVFTLLRSTGLGGNWYELVLAAAVTLLCAGLLALFLGPGWDFPSEPPATIPISVRASSLDPTFTVTVGLCLSNALTALSGAMVGQYQKTVDINSGTGIVVIGLACLIIGETVLGRRTVYNGYSGGAGGLRGLSLYLRRGVLHQGGAGGVPEAAHRRHCGAGHCRAEHPEVGDIPEAQNVRQK